MRRNYTAERKKLRKYLPRFLRQFKEAEGDVASSYVDRSTTSKWRKRCANILQFLTLRNITIVGVPQKTQQCCHTNGVRSINPSNRPSDPFQSVFFHIGEVKRRKKRVLMAIDGMCASGKSTLARLVAERYVCNVFHMDDFFLPPVMRTIERFALPGGNADVERFETEVMEPLLHGDTVRCQRYDCKTGEFIWQPPAEPKPLEIVEGAYSLHPKLRHAYDLAVGMCVTPEEQLRRIVAREGEARLPDFITHWIPLEERYLAEIQVWARCDLVIDTSGLF